MRVSACTTNRITGGLTVVNWNEYKNQWPYLERIEFPCAAKRQIVDLLIALDCVYQYCATEEIRGRSEQPIARLTPLRWTCIGNPHANDRPVLHTHFAYTFFASNHIDFVIYRVSNYFPFLSSNIPSAPAYGIYVSQ